ncbi:MAG: peptidoglycan DD-metalloendopeptidase family protein [Microvirga sp.]
MAPAPGTGSVPAPGPGGYSAHGGTSVTVGSTDTLNTISQRYGVPPAAILTASGMTSPAQVRPGATVTIPVYNAGGAPTRVASIAPVQVQASQGQASQGQAPAPVAPQPKFRLVESPRPAAAAAPKVAAAEPVAAQAAPKRVRPGMAAEPVAALPAQPVKAKPVQVASASSEPLVSAPRPLDPQKAAIQPQPVKPVAPPAQAASPAAAAEPAKAAEPVQTASLNTDEFRWPARGRVIAGFGANGGNEGINIAVPEGTPVKAAESGVVTYAGSEVKGYGNLVLIRHENGFVSAYAHNGSLNVKRGEPVKRGQVIAVSGQSGNVTSPQLHFELRKGATPVDPVPHLGG